MSWIDWTIVGVYVFLVTVVVSLFARKHVHKMSDFLVAGRGVRNYLGIAGLISAELGLISVMALAETGYKNGFSSLVLGLCFSIGVTFIGLTGFIIAELRKYRIMTIPEFYELRYGPTMRWIGGAALSLAGIMNMGIYLRVDSMFFAGISGTTDVMVIRWIMVTLLALVLVYTLIGGMVSVLFANYIQFIFLMAGVFTATVFAVKGAGWNTMVEEVHNEFGLAGFSPFAADDMGWPLILLSTLVYTTLCCLWQPAAAMGLSVENIKVAKRMFLWSGLTFMGRGTIPIIWGIAAFAYFKTHPGLDSAENFEPIMAMPIFMSKVLPVGIMGFVVAGLAAAAMSTYNAYLLAWSGIINQDVVQPLFKRKLSERIRLTINRVLIVLIGLFLLWWGVFYTPPKSYFLYQQVTGTMYLAGALATVFLGLYWKRANTAGAFAATAVGFVFSDHERNIPRPDHQLTRVFPLPAERLESGPLFVYTRIRRHDRRVAGNGEMGPTSDVAQSK